MEKMEQAQPWPMFSNLHHEFHVHIFHSCKCYEQLAGKTQPPVIPLMLYLWTWELSGGSAFFMRSAQHHAPLYGEQQVMLKHLSRSWPHLGNSSWLPSAHSRQPVMPSSTPPQCLTHAVILQRCSSGFVCPLPLFRYEFLEERTCVLIKSGTRMWYTVISIVKALKSLSFPSTQFL